MAVVHSGGHFHVETGTLRATLPPTARDVLSRHEERVVRLLTDVLNEGVSRGVFGADLEPASDAPLILGLAAAANPANPGRAITLARRIVNPKENP